MRSAESLLRGAACAGLLALAGCEAREAPPQAPRVGIANPASVHCVDSGGRLEIVDTAGGQVGFCTLPNGRRVEEWALYHEARGAAEPPPPAEENVESR